MDLYKFVDRRAHRLAWRLYKLTGINLHQIHAVAQAVQNNWVRPFDRLPLQGVGAEIGVYRGIHARSMLRRHPGITKLYLFDAYKPYGGDLVGEVKLLDEARQSCLELLAGDKRVVHVYENSPTCAERIPDESLDFCYIDGGHDEVSVATDIQAMWWKVKPGGIIGGHDCSSKFPGVIRAVVGTLDHNTLLSINVETPDWWAIKP